MDTLGYKMSPDKLGELKDTIEDKGLFHRKLSDPSFREGVEKILKNIKMAHNIISQIEITHG